MILLELNVSILELLKLETDFFVLCFLDCPRGIFDLSFDLRCRLSFSLDELNFFLSLLNDKVALEDFFDSL